MIMATICLVVTLLHRPCPPLSVCQTVCPSAWFGTAATRRVAVFLPPTAARSLCQTRTLPSSLPAQDLPPREPRTDSSGETVSTRGSTHPRLSSRLPPVPRAASSSWTRKRCSQSTGESPSLVSAPCQGQAGWPPLKFNGRARATSGLFGLEKHAKMSSERPQFSRKGILAPNTRDQGSGTGLIRSRGLPFRKGQRAVRELLGVGLSEPRGAGSSEGRCWEHIHLGGEIAVGETSLLITNKRLLFLMNRLNFPPPTWFRLLLSRNGAVPRFRGWGAGETPTPRFPASQRRTWESGVLVSLGGGEAGGP